MIGKRSVVLAACVTAATLVPLVVFGGVGFAQGLPSASQYQYGKITICHHTHSAKHPTVTITISMSAWRAHQRHGDTQGACPAPKSATTPTTSTTHGNSGNSGNNGNGNNGHHGKP